MPKGQEKSDSKASLERSKSSRLLQRRNHLKHSDSSGKLQNEEGSDSECESDSSDEDAQEVSPVSEGVAGMGPLLQAVTCKWKGHTENMVVQIVKSGMNVNERLKEPWDPGFGRFKQTIGAQPLHFAVRLGLLKACAAMIEYKADIDAQTNTGVSPLMVAVMFSRLDVARLLVQAKASVLRQDQNCLTVTDIAIVEGNAQMVQLLVEREKQEDEEMENEVMQAAIDAGADISLLPAVDQTLALDDKWLLQQMIRKNQSR